MKALITCLALLASASSLAAWGNESNRDYQQSMNQSIPYYQGGRVSEVNYDNEAMGPYYNNNNKNPSSNSNQGLRPGHMMNNSTGFISLNETSNNVGERIRKAIQKDTSLSSNARAVLVTADANGQVTVSGSVLSEAEKAKLESVIKSVEGVRSVKLNVSIQSHK